MARKKEKAPEPARYVIRKGLIRYTDEGGTSVEAGPGGKVWLTDEEVEELPEGVEVETPEQRDARLGDRKLEVGIVRSPQTAQPMAPGNLSDESIAQLSAAMEKLAAAPSSLSDETVERLIAAIDTNSQIGEKLLAAMAPEEPPAAGESDKTEEPAAAKGGKK